MSPDEITTMLDGLASDLEDRRSRLTDADYPPDGSAVLQMVIDALRAMAERVNGL